jgi:hypothetical protein
MKKITQNLTKLSWHSGLLAIAFLFSLTINAQEVGQEYLANPGINSPATDAENGVGGQGNFPGQLGGWGAGNGGAYAVASGANGDCYSPDRMFKLFKVGGADGQYINQTITALPAGNYNWSFYTQWNDVGHANGTNGLPTWSADGDSTPKFTVLYEDADGAWVSDQVTVLPEPSAAFTWVQSTGTYTNTETRNVRIKFAKNGGTATAPSNLDKLMFIDEASFAYASASAPSSDLSMQGVIDFSLPGKYMKAVHVKATADIADLSVYSIESYSSEPRTEPSAVLPLSGTASAGDDILFWFSNAENAANLYMNASGIFDVVVNDTAFNVFNGDDPLTLSMNGTVVETYGELGVDGTGEAWEYLDTWAYKVDGAWTYGAVNCTDGSYFTWDSGCAYPLAVGQQATGASTDLVTAFSEDMNVVPSGGFWYNEGEAPIERKTASNVPGSDTSAMKYTDDGTFAYSNMQIQFTSKVDMSSMNTFTVDVYVDGTTTTGTAPVNLALKLQDSSEGTPWTNQNVIIQDITADTWTTLTFAFNDDASMSRDDVDRIVVQFNGEGNNDQVVAYMKNMVGSYTEPVATLYTDVTFTVNTSTIEVGANGMYLGGGIIGDATAHAMTDADGDGTWEVTLSLQEGVTGNYIFLNSPNDGGDWGAKEVLTDQECADGQYDDRLLAPVGADDYTLQHCFGTCYIDGTCGPVGPCDSALALTPGTTQTGNTSEWGDLFNDSTCLGSYDGGDDALFMYTATADGETLSVTVSGQGAWSGVAMSQGCPTEGGEVCVGSQTSSSSDALSFTSDPLIAGEVYYIHISTWPTPQATDFILDTAVIAAPSCIAPTGLTATGVSPTGATLSWVSSGTAFMVELQPAGSAQGTAGGYVIGDVENITTTSVTIPEGSLAPSTSYDFFVVNICGEGDLSEYAGPSTFNTLLQGPSCGETLSYDYPTGSSGGSGFATNFTEANAADLLFTSTVDNAGEVLTLDIGGSTENNYDWVYVTDGAGNVLLAPVSGTLSESVESAGGTVNVYLASDTSVTSGPVTFTVSCTPFTAPTWAGDWYLDPTAGSLAVGPDAGSVGSWWSNSADDVTTRACLFDDIYRFGADGTFENVLGDQTWLEGWQEGQEGEGCGAPIAPHDGSNAANYTYTDTSVTVSGSGAFLGLAKVHNTGENGAPAGDTITYEVISVDETYMTVHINFGGGVWAFRFINSTALGIDDVNPVSSFNFFPNPVNNVLTIKAQASIDSITVYNMLGQAVVRSTPNTTDSTVDMSALQTGAYFVQVSINNTVKTVRVIKN